MLNFEHQDLGVNRQKIGYQNVRYLGPVKVDYVISNLITILAKSLNHPYCSKPKSTRNAASSSCARAWAASLTGVLAAPNKS